MSIKQQSCVETMKQALEALELNMAYSQTMNLITGARASQETFKAITSLCQAIARAEGTLEAEKQASWSGDPSTQDYASTQQEPVAYANDDWSRIDFPSNKVPTKGGPLYTSPLQRCPNCDSLERQNAELDLRLAEQDQAPFGFLTNHRQRFNFEPNITGLKSMPMTIDWKIPLYGSPQPQRQWVGLTWNDMPDEWVGKVAFMEGAKWAEAKLKEKNT